MRMMVRVGGGSPCDVIAHQTEAPSRGTPQVGGLVRSLGVSVAKPHYKLPEITLASDVKCQLKVSHRCVLEFTRTPELTGSHYSKDYALSQ